MAPVDVGKKSRNVLAYLRPVGFSDCAIDGAQNVRKEPGQDPTGFSPVNRGEHTVYRSGEGIGQSVPVKGFSEILQEL